MACVSGKLSSFRLRSYSCCLREFTNIFLDLSGLGVMGCKGMVGRSGAAAAERGGAGRSGAERERCKREVVWKIFSQSFHNIGNIETPAPNPPPTVQQSRTSAWHVRCIDVLIE
jgi:hypothetical protein